MIEIQGTDVLIYGKIQFTARIPLIVSLLRNVIAQQGTRNESIFMKKLFTFSFQKKKKKKLVSPFLFLLFF